MEDKGSKNESWQHDYSPPNEGLEKESKSKSPIIRFLGMLLVVFAFFGKVIKPLFILLKFSKFGATFISMFITVIVYSLFFGWKFALGLVILLLIHENGHLLAAKKIGLPVSKPIFIPFVGAFISMKEMPKSAKEEAIIGLGGPLLGGLAAMACFFLYDTFDETYWLAIGYVGCFLNLFNLVPLGFLDGGRIATAISLWLWVPGTAILGVLAFKLGSPLVFLVLILGLYEGYKVFKKRNTSEALQYYHIEPSFRLKMGLAYLLLVAVLGVGMGISLDMLNNFRNVNQF